LWNKHNFTFASYHHLHPAQVSVGHTSTSPCALLSLCILLPVHFVAVPAGRSSDAAPQPV
jgi:hypothetical protein